MYLTAHLSIIGREQTGKNNKYKLIKSLSHGYYTIITDYQCIFRVRMPKNSLF